MIVNKKSIYYFRLFTDLISLNICFFAAAIIAQSFKTLISRDYMFILEMGLNVTWLFFSNITNLYEDTSARYFAFQFVNIIKNLIVQVFAAVFFIFITKEDLFTRNFIVLYTVLFGAALGFRVIIFRTILVNLRKQGKNIRNLIIIGAGETGRKFRVTVQKNPDFGYNFIGFVDEKDFTIKTDEVLGTLNELDNIIMDNRIEEAVIALPDSASPLLDSIIRICNKHAVKTHIIPDYFRFMSKKFHIAMIGNFPIITVRNEPLEEIHWRILKRTFDILFSIILILLVLWWLMPLIAIILKLDSKGPVFFIQDRIGVRNRKFPCYKFRTLTHQNQAEQFMPVIKNDLRITKFGKFLRKSNLDEIPQFINVLKGEMSVVGPRPHAIPYDKKYGQIVEAIKLRHNVKPGITGWAQVHGLRGDVAEEEENTKRTIRRIEHDLWYIENWSFWLDFQIIILTVWQMVKGDTKGV